MGMKEWGTLGVVIIMTILVAGLVTSFTGNSNSGKVKDTVVPIIDGPAQEVTLSFKNYGYVVSPPTVKAGQPVRMIADVNSLVGCMSAVRIPKLGVSKNVRNGDNIIEFTPTSPGKYTITCSMGMGTGEIIVK